MLNDIDASLIFRSANARPLNKARVSELAASIREVGLINPVCVRRVTRHRGTTPFEAFDIIAGHHRYEALISLKADTIKCIVMECDNLHAELAEIDENLIRTSLTPAQEAEAIFRRKAIYEELHPETKHGAIGNGRVDNLATLKAERFTAATSQATGKDERTIRRAAARGEALGDDLDAIAGTSLDKGVELDALAKMQPEERKPFIERAKAGERVSARADFEAAERRRDMERRNNDVNRVVEMTDAQRFAEWLLERSDLSEIDVVISWLQGTKAKDVIAAIRREAQ